MLGWVRHRRGRVPALAAALAAALGVALLVAAPARAAGPRVQELLAKWLDKPGVRVVAVEVYSETCAPCMEAVPRWEALRKKYAGRGLRLVVINIDDYESDTQCKKLPWRPDLLKCSPELADELGVTAVPQAFVWSWQGNLLVQGKTHIAEVEQALEEYFDDKNPRVIVEVAAGQKQGRKRGQKLRRLIEGALSVGDKLTLVTDDVERRGLAKLRQASHDLARQEDQQCEAGQEISANMRLVVEEFGDTISLALQDIESGRCSLTITADWDPARAKRSAHQAVYELLSRLRQRPPRMPAAGRPGRPGRGDGRSRTRDLRQDRAADEGRLFLRVERPGITYAIDGVGQGAVATGPPVAVAVTPRRREYSVRLRLAGHHDIEAPVLITPDQLSATIDTRGRWRPVIQVLPDGGEGILDLTSTPANAEILLDGVLLTQKTPSSVRIPSGRPVRVQVRRKFHVPVEREVTLEVGGVSKLELVLKRDAGTLTVRTNPPLPEAEIWLNGKLVGHERWTNPDQRSGGYVVEVRAPLYHPVRREGFLDHGAEELEEVELKPAFGRLELTIALAPGDDEGDATQILVDQQALRFSVVSLAPDGGRRRLLVTVDRVPSGTHTVEIVRRWYKVWEQGGVEIADGGVRRLQAPLEARFGTLHVSSELAGCTAEIDGQAAGRLPLVRKLDVGTHQVIIRPPTDQYHPFSQDVLVRKGEDTTVVGSPPARLGGVTLVTQPPGAQISLDGVPVGTSTLQVKDLLVGPHTVHASHPGFTPTTRELTVREGKLDVVEIKLERLGAVEVVCDTLDADRAGVRLAFDGQVFATHRRRFAAVSTGRHDVVCTSPKGHEVSQVVHARPGENRTVVLDLQDPLVLLAAWKELADARSQRRTLLFGAAAGTLVGGVVLAALAYSEQGDIDQAALRYDEATTAGDADAASRDLTDLEDGQALLGLGSGAFVAVAAAMAVGAWWVGSGADPPPAGAARPRPRASMALSVSPAGGLLIGSRSF